MHRQKEMGGGGTVPPVSYAYAKDVIIFVCSLAHQDNSTDDPVTNDDQVALQTQVILAVEAAVGAVTAQAGNATITAKTEQMSKRRNVKTWFQFYFVSACILRIEYYWINNINPTPWRNLT